MWPCPRKRTAPWSGICFSTMHIAAKKTFALRYGVPVRGEVALLPSCLKSFFRKKMNGNVSFEGHFFERALAMAIETGAGLVFLHSHPSPGWQGMSRDDVVAEERLAPRVCAATGRPLLGMTLGTDEAWSGRFWFRRGRGQYERQWCGSVRTVGDGLNCTFHEKLAPPPPYREELRRTTSAWGESSAISQGCVLAS